MKNFFNNLFSGINGKIMKILIVLSISMIVLFVSVAITLLHMLHVTLDEVQKKEYEVVENNSKDAVMNITKDSFLKTVTWASDQIDDEFWIFCHDYYVLKEQVEDVLNNPGDYSTKQLEEPKKENDGKFALQLLYPENYNKNNPGVRERLGRIANLAPMMREIVRGNDGRTMDCYVALPDGAAIAMDDKSAGKYDKNGNVKSYDASQRDWFKGAVEKGDIYFTETIKSHFYDGLREVTWGLPVYVDGELAVVLNGAAELGAIDKKLSERNVGETGFTVLISAEGHIVCSPRSEGELARDEDNTKDARLTTNPSLADAVTKAVNQETGFSQVTLDNEPYYVAYSPVDTPGWTLMIFISENELEHPTSKLQEDMRVVSDETAESFDKNVKLSAAILIILLFLIVIIFGYLIYIRTKKALKPMDIMTDRIRRMDKEDMVFKMEDTFKTDDEIEVLAEAFSDMSDRLQVYLKEIIEKTAQEERVNAEIDTASRIQLAMLPSITDEISSRKEFDIYADMVPAKYVGGDLYDFFLIDDNHLAIVVGDVSGKGISAALFMVLAKNTLQNQLMQYGTDVVKAVTKTNKLLIRDNAAKMFVTVWVGVLTLDTGMLRFVDAGHDYAAICKKNGEFVIEKDNHSPVLGMVKKAKLKLNELQLRDGDTVYLYTDGIVEARNSNNEMYKAERMLKVLNTNPSLSPKELDEALRKDVGEFTEGTEQFDDMTTLCIRYNYEQG